MAKVVKKDKEEAKDKEALLVAVGVHLSNRTVKLVQLNDDGSYDLLSEHKEEDLRELVDKFKVVAAQEILGKLIQ